MTGPSRIFAVENKLGQIAREPGGRRPEDAIRAAEGRVESVRGSSAKVLVEKAEQLTALAAKGRGGDTSVLDAIYDTSNATFGIAGTFGLGAQIGRAHV